MRAAVFMFLGFAAAFAQTKPEWDNPAIVHIGTEKPHATMMVYPGSELARTGDRAKSPWFQSLNGTWKFRGSERPSDRPVDFYRADYDDSGWGPMPVPASWQMHGVGAFTRLAFRRRFTSEDAGRRTLLRPKGPSEPPRSLRQRFPVTLTHIHNFPVYAVKARPDAPATVIYLHGGAYTSEIVSQHWSLVAYLAEQTGCDVHVPIYGLAPEHDGLTALEFVTRVIAAQDRPCYLAGDSAGGGLALVLLSSAIAQARQTGKPAPICAAAMSPWIDLALAGETMRSRAEADPLLTRDSLAMMASLYLGEHSALDPLASALHSNLAHLPPVLIHVGEDEILLDDSRRYAGLVEGQGGWCEVHVWEGMVHVFQSSFELLRAGKESLEAISGFLEHQLRGSASAKQKVST
jgi:acetyl esterase/lipase